MKVGKLQHLEPEKSTTIVTAVVNTQCSPNPLASLGDKTKGSSSTLNLTEAAVTSWGRLAVSWPDLLSSPGLSLPVRPGGSTHPETCGRTIRMIRGKVDPVGRLTNTSMCAVGNVRYRRRERSVASRLPKPDRKLSDYNQKGYRAFPTAVADIPDYIQDGASLEARDSKKPGQKRSIEQPTGNVQFCQWIFPRLLLRADRWIPNADGCKYVAVQAPYCGRNGITCIADISDQSWLYNSEWLLSLHIDGWRNNTGGKSRQDWTVVSTKFKQKWHISSKPPSHVEPICSGFAPFTTESDKGQVSGHHAASERALQASSSAPGLAWVSDCFQGFTGQLLSSRASLGARLAFTGQFLGSRASLGARLFSGRSQASSSAPGPTCKPGYQTVSRAYTGQLLAPVIP
ncbi:hypothetical protein Bbelb_230760 [Branchiostoma belcheri]|nr:hypothetical protein Bbelb_230760 [Branchiostoma belcheri]